MGLRRCPLGDPGSYLRRDCQAPQTRDSPTSPAGPNITGNKRFTYPPAQKPRSSSQLIQLSSIFFSQQGRAADLDHPLSRNQKLKIRRIRNSSSVCLADHLENYLKRDGQALPDRELSSSRGLSYQSNKSQLTSTLHCHVHQQTLTRTFFQLEHATLISFLKANLSYQ